MIQERLAVSQSVRPRLRRFVRSGDNGVSSAEKSEKPRASTVMLDSGLGCREGLPTQAIHA